MKTILVFSHNHNTFDKKRLLENPHPDYFKESAKTVDEFIATPQEQHIKKFFLDDIDTLLAAYEPGEPKMKPDVLEQTKKIEEERKRMQQLQHGPASTPTIMINEPGKEPRAMSPEETLQIIQKQQQDLQMLVSRNKELEEMVVELQNQILKKTQRDNSVARTETSESVKLKSEPEIFVSI